MFPARTRRWKPCWRHRQASAALLFPAFRVQWTRAGGRCAARGGGGMFWLLLLPAALAAYVFCTAPARREREIARLYAHRGLHGQGVCENSLGRLCARLRSGRGHRTGRAPQRRRRGGRLSRRHAGAPLRLRGGAWTQRRFRSCAPSPCRTAAASPRWKKRSSWSMAASPCWWK